MKKVDDVIPKIVLISFFAFVFFAVLGFEFRALHLLGRSSTA
jgi:hypothetical protein